jgi:ribonuclease R
MIHRIIKTALHGELDDKRMIALGQTLPQTAAQCSEREKLAMDAERAVEDLEKCKYMDEPIGETYDGVISGVTSFGLFVELANTIEGMIKLTSLSDDYYICDEKHYRLIGRSNGRTLSLGDQIRIKVAGVDMEALRVEFLPMLEKVKGRKPRQSVHKEKRRGAHETGTRKR